MSIISSNSHRFSPQKPERGFTLIELVVVIVILGILAATALPKFVDLGKDARISLLKGLEGTLKSTAAMWRTKCELNVNGSRSGEVTFSTGGQSYKFLNCYPEAGTPEGTLNGSIDTLVDYDKSVFLVTMDGLPTTQFQLKSASKPSECMVTYTESNAPTNAPVTKIVDSGC